MKHLSRLTIVLLLFIATGCCINHAPKPSLVVNEQTWLRTNLLTSDRIKEKFGSFGVTVLQQDEAAGVRLSNLYSLDAGLSITRTLALTEFKTLDERLLNAHHEILKGGSIGATLTKHGFTLHKKALFMNNINIKSRTKLQSMMHTKQKEVAALIYKLEATKDNVTLPYCRITEFYSPAFLSLDELKFIYSDKNSEHASKVKETTTSV